MCTGVSAGEIRAQFATTSSLARLRTRSGTLVECDPPRPRHLNRPSPGTAIGGVLASYQDQDSGRVVVLGGVEYDVVLASEVDDDRPIETGLPSRGTVCSCSRCACVNEADAGSAAHSICGCCLADCPDVCPEQGAEVSGSEADGQGVVATQTVGRRNASRQPANESRRTGRHNGRM